jgi:hypothetical protein
MIASALYKIIYVLFCLQTIQCWRQGAHVEHCCIDIGTHGNHCDAVGLFNLCYLERTLVSQPKSKMTADSESRSHVAIRVTYRPINAWGWWVYLAKFGDIFTNAADRQTTALWQYIYPHMRCHQVKQPSGISSLTLLVATAISIVTPVDMISPYF